MRFDVFTLFPNLVLPYLEGSILQRARERELLQVEVHDIRAWTSDKHHVTDEPPYGGGGGMVMKPEPIFAAVEGVLGAPPACPVILLTPQGRRLHPAGGRRAGSPSRDWPCCAGATKASTSASASTWSPTRSRSAIMSSPAASCRP